MNSDTAAPLVGGKLSALSFWSCIKEQDGGASHSRFNRAWMMKIFHKCIAGNDLCCHTEVVTIQNRPERGKHAHQELRKFIRLAAALPQE